MRCASSWSPTASTPSRITTISYGKEKPIDAGTGEEADQHNRNARTAIVVRRADPMMRLRRLRRPARPRRSRLIAAPPRPAAAQTPIDELLTKRDARRSTRWKRWSGRCAPSSSRPRHRRAGGRAARRHRRAAGEFATRSERPRAVADPDQRRAGDDRRTSLDQTAPRQHRPRRPGEVAERTAGRGRAEDRRPGRGPAGRAAAAAESPRRRRVAAGPARPRPSLRPVS